MIFYLLRQEGSEYYTFPTKKTIASAFSKVHKFWKIVYLLLLLLTQQVRFQTSPESYNPNPISLNAHSEGK